jgi:hypothetical protein
MPSNQDKREWPAEVEVCLECGKVGVDLRRFRDCTMREEGAALTAEHGPTQKVEVVPKSALEEVELERDAAKERVEEVAERGAELTAKEKARADLLQATLDNLRAGLERIEQTDWTQPPVDMPDEMARAALGSLHREEDS